MNPTDTLEIVGTPVKRWGYEQAFADHVILKFNRQGWGEYERSWSQQFNRSAVNKVTYEIQSHNDSTLTFYITFHDFTVYIGMCIRPYGAHPLPDGESIPF